MKHEGVWHKLTAKIPASKEDDVAFALGDWVERGYEVLDRQAQALVPEAAALALHEALFSIYVQPEDVDSAADAFEGALQRLLGGGSGRVQRMQVEPGWSERWKEFFDVTEVTPRLVIRPTWRGFGGRQGVEPIDLDPGAAFGTGSHATTQLCLRALDELSPVPTLLDLGTGSGVLAVGAALLGCRRIDAFDTDPLAVEVALENVWGNAVDDCVVVREGSVEAAGPAYAGVVANIMAGPLVEMSAALAGRVAPGGWIVLSGVLREEAERVVSTYEALGLLRLRLEEEGEWACIWLGRPSAEPLP